MASRFSYTLDSSLDSVNKVEEAAEQLAQKSGLDEDQTFQLTMAVREAAVNAVLHGNAYDPEKKITASFENTGSSLIIRISDQGNGLDPATLPDPLARKICSAAPAAEFSSSDHLWTRYTSNYCTPAPS